MDYRLHVVSLPHTQTTNEYSLCAYTKKVILLCKMMKKNSVPVFLYSSEENEADCDEHISCITKKEQEQTIGQYDFRREFFRIEWTGEEPYWKIMNGRAIEEIKKRLQPQDIICLVSGYPQRDIANAFPHNPSVEFAVGYKGIYAPFRVFESYAWMHYVYGLHNIDDGRFYDAVIHGYADPDEFLPVSHSDGYLLYIGRLIYRKGVTLASDIAQRTGKKLLLVGQGAKEFGRGYVKTSDFTLSGDHIEYVGSVSVRERASLYQKAYAVLVPTLYIEPFANVHVEAMMAGAPVITTDFGVFTETVVHGVTGFRFRTVGEAAWAVDQAKTLSREHIARYARKRFSIDAISPKFLAYFHQIRGLYTGDDFYGNGNVGVSMYNRYA